MYFTAYFSESGVPKTGLSPTITIQKVSDNSVVVNAQAMTEVGNGFYKYSYTTDNDESYVGVADSVTLTGSERYAPIATEVQGDVDFVRDFLSGKWEITGNHMIFSTPDGLTELTRFDLFDVNGNPTMTQVYKREVV